MTNPFTHPSTYKENIKARLKKQKEGYSIRYLKNREAYLKKQHASR